VSEKEKGNEIMQLILLIAFLILSPTRTHSLFDYQQNDSIVVMSTLNNNNKLALKIELMTLKI
jgi:hypothetical protein